MNIVAKISCDSIFVSIILLLLKQPSFESRIFLMLRENPTLWHDLSDWMNGHLDSMTEAQEGNWTKEESHSVEDM